MSLFFRLFLLLLLFFVSARVFALDIYSVYSSSCARDVGVILNIDNQEIDLLRVDGKVIKVPRYKVIYLSTYPTDVLPINRLETTGQIPILDIDTRTRHKITPLLSGWPVNFTKNEVSFLTLAGRELLVKKIDLWGLKKRLFNDKLTFKKKYQKNIYFKHPYPFSHCEKKSDRYRKSITPQKLYADAVDIKHEFDRLQEGHEELDKFISRQKFYPAPQVYTNVSRLGMWLMLDSRYGRSKSRENNFSPFIVNELSNGAYSYQHELSTGSGPLLYASHSEIQSHFYYRMKAEYVHFSFFADPNLLLVGSQYDWRNKDLDNFDFRAHESAMIEFGLDFGAFSLEIAPVVATHVASKLNAGSFFEGKSNMARFGLRYTGLNNIFTFFVGGMSESEFSSMLLAEEDYSFKLFRMNHIHLFANGNKLTSSFISKEGEYIGNHNLKMTSLSLTSMYEYQWKKRYFLSVLIGLEKIDFKSGANDDQKYFPLLGINGSVEF